MIPLIEREIVNKQWMNKEEFMEMFALTQSLPGVFAVNISIFVGYKLYKVGGSLVLCIGYDSSLFRYHDADSHVFLHSFRIMK